jgi:hypothetical protein
MRVRNGIFPTVLAIVFYEEFVLDDISGLCRTFRNITHARPERAVVHAVYFPLKTDLRDVPTETLPRSID